MCTEGHVGSSLKTNYLKAFNGPKNSIEPFRPIMLEL